jgi:RNA polymerase sigma-70 factor (ECF subfamily)
LNDERDLVSFCERMFPRMVAVLVLQGVDVAVAEELVQETLVKVWERWGSVGRMISPEAWAYRVAFNLSTSRWRRRAIERRAMSRIESSRVVADDDEAAAITVREAVYSLPERQRAAVVLRYYADLPVAEVATVLGCAPGTVKALTSQGIGGLRQRLSGTIDLEGADRA